jgi:hypothetical protein
MSDPAIRFDPLPDATPEAELEVLAAVYSFLIRHVNRKAAFRGGCADQQGGESEQSKAPLGSGGSSATNRREDGSDKPSKQRRRLPSEQPAEMAPDT